MAADLVGVSLALGPNDACYIPLGHGGTDMFAEKPVQVDRNAALAALKPLLESDAVLKVGQNIKYDLTILARARPEKRSAASRSRRSTIPW
jgi:DNA polymerase-1